MGYNITLQYRNDMRTDVSLETSHAPRNDNILTIMINRTIFFKTAPK